MSAKPTATPTAIDHVGIVVHSIDTSLAFYLDRLGLVLVHDGVAPEAGVRLAYLAPADSGSSACCIQLVEPLIDGPIREHLAQHGEGLHHVCLAVPDLDGYLKRISPEAIEEIFLGGRDRLACFLPSVFNGALIEVIEVGDDEFGARRSCDGEPNIGIDPTWQAPRASEQ